MRKKSIKIGLLIVIGLLLIGKFTNISYQKTSYHESISSYSSADSEAEDSIISFNEPYEIVLHGLDTIDNERTNPDCYLIHVYVEQKSSIGKLIYMPFYKPISIEAEGVFSWKNPSSQKPIHTENFDMSAQLNILGSCSVKEARQKANEHLYTSIQKHIKRVVTDKIKS
ncbi:hypothetical protein [Carboxylicivirga caseinilyticus]|uniref:hypothetical protein n=1 Tax=Carboxylicivirga caseinilyticus TaxID=3417572 RepID=UPI003D33AF5D|nr:hypothetical protein [Marinilabiliaceae bacterium A049]